MVLYFRLIDFVISVERQRDLSLAGHPLVVGGAATSGGYVMAASGDAREAGVEPGRPLSEARRRCPDAVFRPGRVERYLDAWSQAGEAVATTHERAEWIGLDEVSVDLAHHTSASARVAAEQLRDRLALVTRMQVACGVANTRVAARVAAARAGPSGLLLVLPGYDRSFLERCRIELLEGLDARAVERLRQAGIDTIGRLASVDSKLATKLLGRGATVLAQLARGRDTRTAGVAPVPARLARLVPVVAGVHEALSATVDAAGRLADILQRHDWTALQVEVEAETRDGHVAVASKNVEGEVTCAGARNLVTLLWPKLSVHVQPSAVLTVRMRDVRRGPGSPATSLAGRVSEPQRAYGS